VWGKVLGAYLNQKERGDVAGYKAKGAGVAIGTDWGFNDCTTFGIAGSYTKVNVDDKNPSPKDQAIKSWQGTAYGWWEFMDGVYLDAMLGLASNHY
jgi:outer membrane autotransporter protein